MARGYQTEEIKQKLLDVLNDAKIGLSGVAIAEKLDVNRITEVAIQRGEFFCQLCEEKDCVHVGFVFSLPDVYEVLNARGIKHPK